MIEEIIKNMPIKEKNILNNRLAKEIECEIDLNHLRSYKSGVSKERIPQEYDWIYKRAAAILLKAVHRPCSIKFLRNHFGSLKNRGVAPDRWYPASGYVLRHLVQNLEHKNYLISHKKGRYTSPQIRNRIIKLYNENK
jgi:small subunit ribosomal protein S19e